MEYNYSKQALVFSFTLLFLVSSTYAGYCTAICHPICKRLLHNPAICSTACKFGCEIGLKHVPCELKCIKDTCLKFKGKLLYLHVYKHIY